MADAGTKASQVFSFFRSGVSFSLTTAYFLPFESFRSPQGVLVDGRGWGWAAYSTGYTQCPAIRSDVSCTPPVTPPSTTGLGLQVQTAATT